MPYYAANGLSRFTIYCTKITVINKKDKQQFQENLQQHLFHLKFIIKLPDIITILFLFLTIT
jgi:hypothetical protein